MESHGDVLEEKQKADKDVIDEKRKNGGALLWLKRNGEREGRTHIMFPCPLLYFQRERSRKPAANFAVRTLRHRKA